MKTNFRIIWSIILAWIFSPCITLAQETVEDFNTDDISFYIDPGQTFSSKPSFCHRLSGVKEITLLEPAQKSQWDNYVYGNFANYFHSLGLKVKIIPTSDYRKTSSNEYGAPIVWCNFYGNASDYCEQANSLVVGLSYGTSPGATDQLVLWAVDVPNKYNWEFRISGVPNKGTKLGEKFKKTLCSSWSFNEKWEFRPYQIASTLTEQTLKEEYSAGITAAIYQSDNYRLGLYEADDNNLFLVYLGASEKNPNWKIGDIKACLEKTSTPGVYLATWFGKWKQAMNTKIIIADGFLKTYYEDKSEDLYLQVFPTASKHNQDKGSSISTEWSGTGFALKDGYIVTNYHVIDEAKKITVKGINGNFSTSFNAIVVATDKGNDLALLRISDSSFTSFGTIPYSISATTSEVGEDIYVLGYPLTASMGDEIKLTTGVISSKSGFQGDVALYQISAPIQPGNSGGPLFDKKGNVIGVVSAKHTGAENVGYAIKTMYLRNLVESCANSSIIPNANKVSTLPLTGKVKSEKNFVFFIKCSSDKN
ncbi:MAG: trypsin-like peptidase domain-containing protein [Bacteroides sp.]|nr:trypsin-like peptidase domain-containing protein [Bacteroides sp.]